LARRIASSAPALRALRDVRPITTRLSAGLVSEFSGVVLAVAGGAMFFEPASVDLVVPSAIFYTVLVCDAARQAADAPAEECKDQGLEIILIRRHGDRAKHPAPSILAAT